MGSIEKQLAHNRAFEVLACCTNFPLKPMACKAFLLAKVYANRGLASWGTKIEFIGERFWVLISSKTQQPHRLWGDFGL